jgi:pilus assembly protein CpaB
MLGTQPIAIPTPEVRNVEVVTAGQNILQGTLITEEMLGSKTLPETLVVVDYFTSKADVVGQYAKYPLAQGILLTSAVVTQAAENVNLAGSIWAPQIPQGMTAIAIPITRLSSAAYGIRDGDFVDILVSLLLVDVDSSYQSILPNYTAKVTGSDYLLTGQLPVLTAEIISGGQSAAQGRTELDATLNEPLYIVPSEPQRPRMVTQMILKNVQILHVGNFPLPGEAMTQAITGPSETGATPTPTPQPGQQAAVTVVRPDMVTLIVIPQDAVTLKYLLDINASITLTLRNPNDQETNAETDAATLQYLLSQYNIPVPAKLPYAVEPRTDTITPPELPNDIVVVTQE